MNIIERPLNREKVMAKNPTLIGIRFGIAFYEHPTLGDESPLIADCKEGFGISCFWDLPTHDELSSCYQG